MAFSRRLQRGDLDAEALTSAMVGIGMAFAADATQDPPIEETLVSASEEGMLRDDLRVLSVLVTWLEVHRERINVDRLTRLVQSIEQPRVRAFWAAIARCFAKDRRFSRLTRLHVGPPVDLLAAGNDFQIARRGEDERFVETALRVPAGTLRRRPADVLEPAQLARRHRTYRVRLLIGPTWRADAWAEIEAAPEISTVELARRAGCAFATAWKVRNDFALWRRSSDLDGTSGPRLVSRAAVE